MNASKKSRTRTTTRTRPVNVNLRLHPIVRGCVNTPQSALRASNNSDGRPSAFADSAWLAIIRPPLKIRLSEAESDTINGAFYAPYL